MAAMTIFTYIKSFYHLWIDIKKQRAFNKSFLLPYMNELETRFSGQFHTGQKEKILNYYGLFIPAVLAASFKRLYEDVFTEAEMRMVTLFGILTPVGDDLFDLDKLDIDSIKAITFTPETFVADSFSAKVAKEIQTNLLQTVPDREAYLEASKNVFEIQIETIKQTAPSITEEELKRITYAKGGYSVIIYHEVLQKASPELWKALFYVGSLMQLANDIFDMHKDVPDGIFTLPNQCKDFRGLRELYMQRVKETNQLLLTLPFGKAAKKEFCLRMNFIISRGLVAIDKFIQLEKQKKAALNFSSLTRKEIVCDMQKPGNILRWLKYIYLLPRI